MIASFSLQQPLYYGGLNFAYDTNNSYVYVDTSGSPLNQDSGVWFLEEVTNADNAFRIRTKVHGQYLYAGDDQQTEDSMRRNVFVWIGAPRDTGKLQLQHIRFLTYFISLCFNALRSGKVSQSTFFPVFCSQIV